MIRWARIGLLLAILALVWAMFGPAIMRAPDIAPERPPIARPDRPQPTLPSAGPRPDAPIIGQIDRIEIDKAARRLTAFQNGAAVRVYEIQLGFAPEGTKIRQGDGKTPEGVFRVDRRNDRSAFHLSLGLDYPLPADRARARAGGYDPGGDIFIHGQPNQIEEGFRVRGDWTDGCVAITNDEIRELFAATPIGTTVEIRP
ncbi:MAG: L,D-transpeptidase family protein [Paracoccus sp. (in: a-proteobacteria)]|nr:L,D-transpeptidase family protein [Paracoccus sp. (in: a-proteobacteria)]